MNEQSEGTDNVKDKNKIPEGKLLVLGDNREVSIVVRSV